MKNKIALDRESDSILFGKTDDLWSISDIELCKSYGMIHENPGWRAYISATSREAMYYFMRKNYASLYSNDKHKGTVTLLNDTLREYYAHVDEVNNGIIGSLPYKDALYKHQREAIAFCIRRRCSLIAHEQGLGKTLTGIAVSQLVNIERCIIVCPAIVKYVWRDELVNWGISEDQITMLDSKNCVYGENEKYIIINYDILDRYSEYLKRTALKKRLVIMDECHYIKNVDTKRFNECFKLTSIGNPQVVLLTGTPITNNVIDAFAYLKIAGHPLGESKSRFINRFSYVVRTKFGSKVTGVRNAQELKALMLNFMHRRTKKDCLDLKPKKIHIVSLDKSEYEIEYQVALREVYADYLRNGKSIVALDGSIHKLNSTLSIAKTPQVIALAEDILEREEKVVVYGVYNDALKEVRDYFGDNAVYVDGSVTNNKRYDNISSFKNDADVSVFVANLKAAGTGITLTEAHSIIINSLPFTHAELAQAIDRLHRIGQEEEVNIYIPTCKGMVDEAIFNMIMRKERGIISIIEFGENTIFDNMAETIMAELFAGIEQLNIDI